MSNIANTVSVDVRALIPFPESLVVESELTDKIQAEHYTEILNDIYDTNVISTDESLEKLDLITKITDPNLRGAALATLGGVHTFTGNYVKAFAAFHKALELAKSPDLLAVVYSELSVLFLKLGYEKEAVTILDEAIRLTRNKKLIWKLKTHKALCFEDLQPELCIDMLRGCLEHYESDKHKVMLGRVKRHLAVCHINLEQFDKAEKWLTEALEIATENSLANLQNSVMNDRGWLLIQQEKLEEARNLFDNLIGEELSPYNMSLALQNIAYLEYERQNTREAIKYHTQSLRLTTWYEMRDMAFEDYYKLGVCHEKLGDPGLAEHFFREGYLELQKEIDLGLRLTGYRKKLLDSYVEFLHKNQRIPHVDIKDEVFGFAMDKTLREIRDIFHSSLLGAHLERSKNAPQLCRHLKINTRTYFIYQKKLGLKRGVAKKTSLEDNPHFSQYVESLMPLTWRQANKKFEDDLFSFLMAKFQHNKKKLSDVLSVSYALVVQKTRSGN